MAGPGQPATPGHYVNGKAVYPVVTVLGDDSSAQDGCAMLEGNMMFTPGIKTSGH